MTPLNILSLFNGISCGRIALDRAGIPVNEYVSYEIDPYANAIAKANYPQDEYNGDVTTADFTQYKDFDLLIGGSPCQGLSIAKQNRQGLEDPQSQLFYEFVRALNEVQPQYFLFENVASMADEERNKITSELGIEPIMINSALVSAQNRKRLYWTNIPNVEQPTDRHINIIDIMDKTPTNERKTYPTPRAKENKNGGIQFDVSGKGHASQQDRAFSIYGKFGVIPCARTITKIKVWQPMAEICFDLTLNEVKALQTIPKDYIIPPSKSGKYNKAFSAIGNGWTVDVIAHILKNIFDKE